MTPNSFCILLSHIFAWPIFDQMLQIYDQKKSDDTYLDSVSCNGSQIILLLGLHHVIAYLLSLPD